MRFVVLFAAVVLASCTPAAPDRTATCSWSWTELPLPPDRGWAKVEVSDGRGTYAGYTFAPENGPQEAVLWQDGRATVLGAAFGKSTQVRSVNANGVVVGEAGSHPVRFRDGEWERLAEPSSYSSMAYQVDAAGNVVGHAFPWGSADPSAEEADEVREQHLVRWPADRSDTYESVEVPFLDGWVWGGTDDGIVLARGKDEVDGQDHAYLGRPDGTWIELDRLDDWPDVVPVAAGGGVVVGTSQGMSGDKTLVEWDMDGRVIRAQSNAAAIDVNSSGVVLSVRPGLWMGLPAGQVSVSRGGVRQGQFPRSGDTRIDAVAIDDDGTVVGEMAKGPSGLQNAPVVARCS